MYDSLRRHAASGLLPAAAPSRAAPRRSPCAPHRWARWRRRSGPRGATTAAPARSARISLPPRSPEANARSQRRVV